MAADEYHMTITAGMAPAGQVPPGLRLAPDRVPRS